MNFNSQVCTTKEQSQRLLDLGLKPETADMIYMQIDGTWICIISQGDEEHIPYEDHFPAWSLHRLFEMICNKECEEHYYFNFSMDYDSMVNVYDSIIEVIERHIKENRFNKEYLK